MEKHQVVSQDINGQTSCSLCNESFLNSAGLKRHIRYVHPRKIVGHDVVPECDKHPREQNMERHTGKVSQDINGQTTCSLCNRSFLNSAGLRRHIQSVHITNMVDQDFIPKCEEESRSTAKEQNKNLEQCAKSERVKRDNLNNIFLRLRQVIELCINQNKGEPFSVPASKRGILSNAVDLVHGLQAKELELKAEKQALLHYRSELATRYIELRDQGYTSLQVQQAVEIKDVSQPQMFPKL